MEKQSNAELFDVPNEGTGKVIINTEFGAFGEDGCIDFIRTKYDQVLDKDSTHPGKQL